MSVCRVIVSTSWHCTRSPSKSPLCVVVILVSGDLWRWCMVWWQVICCSRHCMQHCNIAPFLALPKSICVDNLICVHYFVDWFGVVLVRRCWWWWISELLNNNTTQHYTNAMLHSSRSVDLFLIYRCWPISTLLLMENRLLSDDRINCMIVCLYVCTAP